MRKILLAIATTAFMLSGCEQRVSEGVATPMITADYLDFGIGEPPWQVVTYDGDKVEIIVSYLKEEGDLKLTNENRSVYVNEKSQFVLKDGSRITAYTGNFIYWNKDGYIINRELQIMPKPLVFTVNSRPMQEGTPMMLRHYYGIIESEDKIVQTTINHCEGLTEEEMVEQEIDPNTCIEVKEEQLTAAELDLQADVIAQNRAFADNLRETSTARRNIDQREIGFHNPDIVSRQLVESESASMSMSLDGEADKYDKAQEEGELQDFEEKAFEAMGVSKELAFEVQTAETARQNELEEKERLERTRVQPQQSDFDLDANQDEEVKPSLSISISKASVEETKPISTGQISMDSVLDRLGVENEEVEGSEITVVDEEVAVPPAMEEPAPSTDGEKVSTPPLSELEEVEQVEPDTAIEDDADTDTDTVGSVEAEVTEESEPETENERSDGED